MTLAERLIRLHEGERLQPYRCTAGKLTIGVGRNLSDRGISREESAYLLANDLQRTEAELRGAYPWVARLDPVRYAVLVDLHFNLGAERFAAFTRTLARIEAGDYAGAASALRASKWASQVGTRATRLIGMMATGLVPPEVA